MDSLTHIVLGASIGEAIMGKQVGKRAMLWGALAASAPDIDALTGLFVSDIDSLILHRGITHSVFIALLVGPIWAYLVWHFNRKVGLLASWILLFTSNILLHDLLDTCTVYGTGLFIPFNDYRYSFDTIFVADPLFTLPLLVSFLLLLFLRPYHPSRKKWNAAGLFLSAAYMLFAFNNHNKASEAVQQAIDEKGIQAEAFFATPTLFNNLLWNVVAKDSTGFWIGYYSIFDKNKIPELHYIPQNTHLLKDWPRQEEITKLMKFTKGYYCVTEKNGQFWFNDIRFGQVNGWENHDSDFAFAFDLTEKADNSIVVQKGRMAGSKREILWSLWERMKGK